MQIVARHTFQAQPSLGLSRRPLDCSLLIEQITTRDRGLDIRQTRGRPAVDHPATFLASAGPHIHQPLSLADEIEIVLDYEQRVARSLEAMQDREQGFPSAGCNPAEGSSST